MLHNYKGRRGEKIVCLESITGVASEKRRIKKAFKIYFLKAF